MLVILSILRALIALGRWTMSALTFPFLTLCALSLLYTPTLTSFARGRINMDTLSIRLITLTLWLTALVVIRSTYIKHRHLKSPVFIRTVIILSRILVLAFSLSHLLAFYVAFEAALIPTLILIIIWGAQPERLRAGIYLILYTITTSLPLLVAILFLHTTQGSTYMYIVYLGSPSLILNLCLIGAFLVKFPIYGLHLWLPKAHVEAPVAGSMLLAGVLLKLGPYGLIRTWTMMPPTCTNTLTIIGLRGATLAALICMRQVDIKSLVAYASVSHMSFTLALISTISTVGWIAAKIILVGHGLARSALFYLVHTYYENTHSRSITINKGIINLAPRLGLWWFLRLMRNIAVPPRLNFTAEVLAFVALSPLLQELMILLILYSTLTLAYSLILFIALHHGPTRPATLYIEIRPLYHTIILGHMLPLIRLRLAIRRF